MKFEWINCVNSITFGLLNYRLPNNVFQLIIRNSSYYYQAVFDSKEISIEMVFVILLGKCATIWRK